jgi:hypothetical protein
VYSQAQDNNTQLSVTSNIVQISFLKDERPEIDVLRANSTRITVNQYVNFTISVFDDFKVNRATLFVNTLVYAMHFLSGNASSNYWTISLPFSTAGEYSIIARAYDEHEQASQESNSIILFVLPAGSSISTSPSMASNPDLSTTDSGTASINIHDFIFLLSLTLLGLLKHRKTRKE